MRIVELKREVYDMLANRPGGMARGDVQTRCGITDPSLESNRARVWALSAAIAGLIRDGFVVSANYGGVSHLSIV